MAALKEWAVICKALEYGKQTILLRKGGILEYRDGFEIKHNVFLLYPTFEHQSSKYIKSDYQNEPYSDYMNTTSHGKNVISIIAKVELVKEVQNPNLLSQINKYHIWNESFIETRMKYNPKKSMNVLLLRVYKLPENLFVAERKEWTGCKSWIDIDIPDCANSLVAKNSEDEQRCKPVIGDLEFQKISNEFGREWR